MNILILGGSGFIGTGLSAHLLGQGHAVTISTRQKINLHKNTPTHIRPIASNTQVPRKPRFIPFENTALTVALAKHDAVINLMGEPLANANWTRAKRRRILASRVCTTTTLSDLLKHTPTPPKVVVSASAIGAYNERSHGVFSEDSPLPATQKTFLNEVCHAWERAASSENSTPPITSAILSVPTIRKICLRIPIVLGQKGGAFMKLLPLYRNGLGSVLGSGRQGFTWIHLTDLVRLISHLLKDSEIYGTLNATAPQPVEMRVFATSLARILGKPLLPAVPKFILKALLGERSELLTEGAFIIPKRVLQTSFTYQYPTLTQALHALLT